MIQIRSLLSRLRPLFVQRPDILLSGSVLVAILVPLYSGGFSQYGLDLPTVAKLALTLVVAMIGYVGTHWVVNTIIIRLNPQSPEDCTWYARTMCVYFAPALAVYVVMILVIWQSSYRTMATLIILSVWLLVAFCATLRELIDERTHLRTQKLAADLRTGV
jgi:hypothetical protein